jgi:hypothetical protein
MDNILGRVVEVRVARNDGAVEVLLPASPLRCVTMPCLCSESSLFVFDNYLILKTCGTTTLLNAVPTIARLARTVCNRQEVAEVYYSRKEFMNPGEQHYPHTSFQDEVQYAQGLLDPSAAVRFMSRTTPMAGCPPVFSPTLLSSHLPAGQVSGPAL